MSASPDYAASAISTPDSVSGQEMVSQMADVAGAMFSLLLLRTLDNPIDEGIPLGAVVEPADPPAVLAPAHTSVDPLPAPVPPVPVPVIDINPAPAPAITSIAMPASVPLLDYVPEPVAPEAPAEPEVVIPVTASVPPPTMAMLSEIGFLDD